MGYINRYLQLDYGEHVAIDYVDVDSSALEEYPALVSAIAEGRSLPLVLVDGSVKSPPAISFAWIVNEFKGMGVLE